MKNLKYISTDVYSTEVIKINDQDKNEIEVRKIDGEITEVYFNGEPTNLRGMEYETICTFLSELVLWARKCDCCGKGMDEGYQINDGEYYFCTEECLNASADVNTQQERNIPCQAELDTYAENCEDDDEDDDNDSFWTTWHDADDKQYQEINGVLTLIEE